MAPRLRSKTGCLRCRSRKKKCDEARPRCGDCSKTGLLCYWSESVLVEDNLGAGLEHRFELVQDRISRASTLIDGAVNPGVSRAICLHFTDEIEYDLVRRWPNCYCAVSLPRAALDHSHLSMFLTVAVQEDFVKPALAMFSSYVLFIKGELHHPPLIILKNYRIAARKLSLELSVGESVQNYLALMVSATMLGMVESSGFGNPQIAVAHFTAAAYACSKFLAQRACDVLGRRTCRLAVELWLYNLPSLCVFVSRKELGQFLQHLNWSIIDVIFHPGPISSVPAHRLSPCLGIPPDIPFLLLHSVHLAQQRRDRSRVTPQVIGLTERLHTVQTDLNHYYGADLDHDVDAQRNRDVSQLFTCAISCYLTKITKILGLRETQSLKSQVGKFMEVLNQERKVLVETSLLWWPLAVMLCSIDDSELFKDFLERSEGFHFDGGCKRRWTVLVKLLTDRRRQTCVSRGGGDGSGNSDYLDLLMMEEGVWPSPSYSRRFDSVATTDPGPTAFWLWQNRGSRQVSGA